MSNSMEVRKSKSLSGSPSAPMIVLKPSGEATMISDE